MTRKILLAGALAGLALGACTATARPEPVVRTVEVKVPVAVQCVPKELRDPPAYVDSDQALRSAAGPEDRFQLLAAGRIQRKQRLAETEPVIRACRAP